MTQLRTVQQGDAALFQTADGGDLDVVGGLVAMTRGPEVAAYLSMFGGDGWWGNTVEDVPARRYDAATGRVLQDAPATSGNLRRVEDAAAADLQWMVSDGVAGSVEVTASITGANRVRIVVRIDGVLLEFTQDWTTT